MLRVEIEDNLRSVRRFAEAVDGQAKFDAAPVRVVERSSLLSSVRMTPPKYRVWEALTSSIPQALDKNEIRRAFELNDLLDELNRLKTESHDPTSTSWGGAVDTTVKELLKRGNPIC